jgi:hypothetical protein
MDLQQIFSRDIWKIVEIRSTEESPADSILKTQEKLREYSPSVSHTPLVSMGPETGELLERSRSLLSCLDSNFPPPTFPSHKPPNMKYIESVLGCRAHSNEILDNSPRSASHSATIPIEMAGHPKSSFDQTQEVPTLSLEDILSEHDIPEEDLVPTPSCAPVDEEASLVVSKSLQLSSFEEMKTSKSVSYEDDLVESLLSEGGAARYLPESRTLNSGSQYQWASTAPLSEAEYEALRLTTLDVSFLPLLGPTSH